MYESSPSYEKLMIKRIEMKFIFFCSFWKRLSFRKKRKTFSVVRRRGREKKFCNIVSCYNFLLLFIELTSQLHPSCLCLLGLDSLTFLVFPCSVLMNFRIFFLFLVTMAKRFETYEKCLIWIMAQFVAYKSAPGKLSK